MDSTAGFVVARPRGRGRPCPRASARPSACPRALGRDQLPREWPRSRHSRHSGDEAGGERREKVDDIWLWLSLVA